MRARDVLALVERGGELEQETVGGARPRALLHPRQMNRPEIERRGAAKPYARRHVVTHRRGDEGAARPLVLHHPGHDDVVLEARLHAQRPLDGHFDLVGDHHEAAAGVLVECLVDFDLVASGDDVAVVVAETDLGAVERAGALGAARGKLEHRLGPQLERMRPFHPFGRCKRPVARRRLGLGRVEHPEQRRPGGEFDVEVAVSLGARSEVELELIVVAEVVAEVDRERVWAVHVGIVALIEVDPSETPDVTVTVRADVRLGADGVGNRTVALGALTSVIRIGTWRDSWFVVRHRSGIK